MTTEEVAVKLEGHDRDIKSLGHRMDDVEKMQQQIMDLTLSVKDLSNSVKSMVTEQKSQGERLSKLEGEPLENAKYIKRTIVTAVLTGIVSAIIGLFIGLLTKGV